MSNSTRNSLIKKLSWVTQLGTQDRLFLDEQLKKTLKIEGTWLSSSIELSTRILSNSIENYSEDRASARVSRHLRPQVTVTLEPHTGELSWPAEHALTPEREGACIPNLCRNAAAMPGKAAGDGELYKRKAAGIRGCTGVCRSDSLDTVPTYQKIY